jgi:hypothetical protein
LSNAELMLTSMSLLRLKSVTPPSFDEFGASLAPSPADRRGISHKWSARFVGAVGGGAVLPADRHDVVSPGFRGAVSFPLAARPDISEKAASERKRQADRAYDGQRPVGQHLFLAIDEVRLQRHYQHLLPPLFCRTIAGRAALARVQVTVT